MDVSSANRLKEAAAESAVKQLENGMIVGLGSGSTATLAVAAIGNRLKEGLSIIGIPTSEKTAAQARQLNIPLTTLAEHPRIDVTIDGADEVESGTLNLIKGGGGNQLREKIVAIASRRMLVIVDETKVVARLGTHSPVPVEVVRFGWQTTAKRLEATGAAPTLRLQPDGQAFLTDDGNYILDCAYGPLQSAHALQTALDGVVGVVEHGLFIDIASAAFIGTNEGVKVLNRDIQIER